MQRPFLWILASFLLPLAFSYCHGSHLVPGRLRLPIGVVEMPSCSEVQQSDGRITPDELLEGLRSCSGARNCRTRTVELFELAIASTMLTIPMTMQCLTNCRNTGDWQTAYRVYKAAKKNTGVATEGRRPRKEVPSIIYGQTAVALARCGAESQTFEVVTEMLSAGVIPTVQTVDNIVLDLSKRGAYQVIIGVFDQLRRYHLNSRISDRALNAQLNACAKARAFDAVLMTYERYMQDDNQRSRLDSIGMSVLIKACNKLSSPDNAIDIIYRDVNRHLVTSSIVERVLAICAQWQLVESSLRIIIDYERGYWDIHNSDLQPVDGTDDEEEYDTEEVEGTNSIISPSHAQLLHELLVMTGKPSSSSRMYSGIVSLLAEAGHIEMAHEVVLSFSAKGGEVIEAMYTSLIYACRHSLNYDKAESLFNDIFSRYRSKVTVATYNSLLSVYAKSGVFVGSKGDELIASMEECGVEWDHRTFAAVMAGSKKDHKRVIDLWHEYKASGCNVLNKAMVMSTLKALQSEGKGLDAYKLLSDISSRPDAGQLPDFAMYKMVLLALKRDQKASTKVVANLLDAMKMRSLEVTPQIVKSAMDVYEAKGDWRQATILLLQTFKGSTGFVDPVVTTTALKTCLAAGQVDIVVRLVGQISFLQAALVHDQIASSQILQCALSTGKVQQVLVILGCFEEHGISISAKAASSAISFMEANHHFDDTVLLFERYIAQHIPPLGNMGLSAVGDDDEDSMFVDLHGYTVAVAKAAVRSALGILRGAPIRNLVLITGRGRNSIKSNRERLDPVLKPLIQGWLRKSDPPLSAAELIANTGRLIISKELIVTWSLQSGSHFTL